MILFLLSSNVYFGQLSSRRGIVFIHISSHECMCIHSCHHLINIHRMPGNRGPIHPRTCTLHTSIPLVTFKAVGCQPAHTVRNNEKKTLYASPVKPHACICNVYQDPAKPKVAPNLRERKKSERQANPTRPRPLANASKLNTNKIYHPSIREGHIPSTFSRLTRTLFTKYPR
jgi:hypothetical protein